MLDPATSKVTVFAVLSYVTAIFWTEISESAKHDVKPVVVRVWPARTLPGRVPIKTKERVERVEIGRNIMATVCIGTRKTASVKRRKSQNSENLE